MLIIIICSEAEDILLFLTTHTHSDTHTATNTAVDTNSIRQKDSEN